MKKVACVQTSALPQEKSGGDSTDFSEGGGLLYTGYKESFGEKCLSGELCIRDLLKFFSLILKTIDTPGSFILLFFSPEKLTRLFLLITCYGHYDNFAKIRSAMTTPI